jgi:hypothetical protein
MGLDMYLYREIYIGAHHEYRNVQGIVELTQAQDDNERIPINVDVNKIVSITEHLLYWRKANAIHGWFVNKVQKGQDDCSEYHVFRSDLEELWQICNDILNVEDKDERDTLAMKLLPPIAGFFFGSTTLDEWYYQDLKKTRDILGKELDDPRSKNLFEISYKYQSSW